MSPYGGYHANLGAQAGKTGIEEFYRLLNSAHVEKFKYLQARVDLFLVGRSFASLLFHSFLDFPRDFMESRLKLDKFLEGVLWSLTT